MYAFKVPVADYSSGAGAGGSMAITTPMPGKVVQLACSVGDTMDKGEPLLILEAMKMEHVIRAPSDGVVVEIERSTFIDDAAHARAVTRALGLAIPALAPDPATNPEVLAARIRSQLQLRGRQGQRRERR